MDRKTLLAVTAAIVLTTVNAGAMLTSDLFAVHAGDVDDEDYDYIEEYDDADEGDAADDVGTPDADTATDGPDMQPQPAPEQGTAAEPTGGTGTAHVKDVTPKTQDMMPQTGYLFSAALFLAGVSLVIFSYNKKDGESQHEEKDGNGSRDGMDRPTQMKGR